MAVVFDYNFTVWDFSDMYYILVSFEITTENTKKNYGAKTKNFYLKLSARFFSAVAN